MILPLLVALSLADPMEDPSFRFCHVEGVEAEEAREWCDLLDDVDPERCPGLRATCEGAERDELDPKEAWEQLKAGCAGGSGGDGARRFAGEPERPREPMACDRDTPESSCEPTHGCSTPMEALGTAVRWGVALLLAAALGVVIRLVLSRMGPREASARVQEVEAPVAELVPLDDVPDLPGNALLSEARSALAAGDPARAVLLARGAALRALGERGRLRLHRSQTDREYLRQVRGEASVHEPLREVLGEAEGVRWAGREPGPDGARRVLSVVEGLLRVVGVGALLLLVAAPAHAWDRYGPDGDAAVAAVLREHGMSVTWRLRGLDLLDGDTDVLVLDSWGIAVPTGDWEPVRAWVEAGGVLVVAGAGGDLESAFPELGQRVDLGLGVEPVEVSRELAAYGLPAPRLPHGPSVAWTGGVGEVWVDVPGGGALVQAVPLGAGAVLAVADARVLQNGALVSPQNQDFLARLVTVGPDAGRLWYPLDARVQLVTVAAQTADSPLDSLANAHLLPLVGQLLLLAVLLALWRGWPFGPLRDPPGEGRRAFAEHARAVGRHYRRLRASHLALSRLAGLWLQRLGPEGLLRAARRGGYPPEQARDLVGRLTGAAETPDGPNRPDDLSLMEDLWRITRR